MLLRLQIASRLGTAGLAQAISAWIMRHQQASLCGESKSPFRKASSQAGGGAPANGSRLRPTAAIFGYSPDAVSIVGFPQPGVAKSMLLRLARRK